MAELNPEWLLKAPSPPNYFNRWCVGSYLDKGEKDEIGNKIIYVCDETYYVDDMVGDPYNTVEFLVQKGNVTRIIITNNGMENRRIQYDKNRNVEYDSNDDPPHIKEIKFRQEKQRFEKLKACLKDYETPTTT